MESYKLELAGCTVNVRLQNGVYKIKCESAIGKTRLCKLLKRKSTYIADGETGQKEVGFTYADYTSGTKLKLDGIKLAILDRYDLYRHDKEITEEIERHRNDCIILLDAKEQAYGPVLPNGRARLKMTINEIEVY